MNGCYVNISSGHTRPKSSTVKLSSLIQAIRGVLFIGLGLFAFDWLGLFVGIGVIDFVLARWLWSLRIEAWGVAVGFSIFHLIFPFALSVSLFSYLLTSIVSVLVLITLALVRYQGYYSYVELAKIDPIETLEASPIHKSVFNLVIVAQLVKVLFMYMGGLMIASYEAVEETLYWYDFPILPIVLILGTLDLIAAIGFYRGHDWAFQLLLVMAGLGFAETFFAGSIPIVLIAVWIITLMMPCWVKWAFYPKVLHRVKSKKLDSSISVPIPTIEQ